MRLAVQFLVAGEDAVFVERDAAFAVEIGLDVGPTGDAAVQLHQFGNVALERLHPLGKRVTQAIDDLEQRQIDVAKLASRQKAAGACFQQTLEIAEIFWNALVPELVRTLFRLPLLDLIILRWP